MGLTDQGLMIVAVLLAVAAFAAVVAGWRLLARPRWWLVPVRAVALLLVVAMSLLAVAIGANRHYEWYASWDDLINPALDADEEQLGARASTAVERRVGEWAPAKDVPLYEEAPAPEDFTPLDGGRWTTVSVRGGRSGHTGDVVVWVPESYFQPENADRHYPVIEFMHGVPGVPKGILTDFKAAAAITGAVARGELRESILLVPSITPGAVDTECVDGPKVKMDTWIAEDVPAWAAAKLRVETDRGSWATEGFSGGGYCSAMLPVRHPATFSAGIVMAGYFRPDFDKRYVPFPPGSLTYQGYDLVKRVQANPPAVALWVQSSSADGKTKKASEELVSAVKPPMSVQSVVLKTAGHRWTIWRDLAPEALAWLGQTAPGFKPVAPTA